MTLELRDKQRFLELARQSLTEAAMGRPLPKGPPDLLERYREPRACFVTLEKSHQLRGCIGHIFPVEPLPESVIHNAAAAGIRDSRFPPVTNEEIGAIHIEVSVLTVPQPLEFDGPADLMRKLRPHVDGVVLELAGRRSTFLPQVWESLPNVETFLNQLALKAGRRAADWRDPSTSVMTYQVESITEPLFHKRID